MWAKCKRGSKKILLVDMPSKDGAFQIYICYIFTPINIKSDIVHSIFVSVRWCRTFAGLLKWECQSIQSMYIRLHIYHLIPWKFPSNSPVSMTSHTIMHKLKDKYTWQGEVFWDETWSHKSLCYFRIWRRYVPWIGILLSNSWLRNFCNKAELRTVWTFTASRDSAPTESWNHAGAEQTQRTADTWWHTGDGLPGHGCVRWGSWIRLNFFLRVIDRSNIWWILLFLFMDKYHINYHKIEKDFSLSNQESAEFILAMWHVLESKNS